MFLCELLKTSIKKITVKFCECFFFQRIRRFVLFADKKKKITAQVGLCIFTLRKAF